MTRINWGLNWLTEPGLPEDTDYEIRIRSDNRYTTKPIVTDLFG
jgi:hypothetical protein